MIAALYRQTGPAAEVLEVEEVERPQPGPGEVLVRVRASGVNPTDYKSRAASYKATQLFVSTLASLLSLGGAMGLIISLFRFRQRERVSNS